MNSPRAKTSHFREWRRRQAYKLLPLFPPLGKLLIRGIGATLRTRFTGYQPVWEMIESRQPFIVVFYHGRQFLLTYQLQGIPTAIMSGISYMGEIQSRILSGFGFTIIKGSSSRGGIRVLVEMIGLVRKGLIGAFAVDGPRGPYHKVKPGAVYVAKKLGVPIIPVATSARWSLVFNSVWDRYLLPMPFSKCTVHFGEPIFLDSDLSEDSISQACHQIGEVLTDLEAEADRIIGRTKKE